MPSSFVAHPCLLCLLLLSIGLRMRKRPFPEPCTSHCLRPSPCEEEKKEREPPPCVEINRVFPLRKPKPPSCCCPLVCRGKVLALELLRLLLEGSGPTFRLGERFLTAIRQYLCVSLLKNGGSSVPAVAHLSAAIFLALLHKFRSSLKAEVSVAGVLLFLGMVWRQQRACGGTPVSSHPPGAAARVQAQPQGTKYSFEMSYSVGLCAADGIYLETCMHSVPLLVPQLFAPQVGMLLHFMSLEPPRPLLPEALCSDWRWTCSH